MIENIEQLIILYAPLFFNIITILFNILFTIKKIKSISVTKEVGGIAKDIANEREALAKQNAQLREAQINNENMIKELKETIVELEKEHKAEIAKQNEFINKVLVDNKNIKKRIRRG